LFCLFADFVLALLLGSAAETTVALIAGIDLLPPVDAPASAFASASGTGWIVGDLIE
jgi:hypothetical protein